MPETESQGVPGSHPLLSLLQPRGMLAASHKGFPHLPAERTPLCTHGDTRKSTRSWVCTDTVTLSHTQRAHTRLPADGTAALRRDAPRTPRELPEQPLAASPAVPPSPHAGPATRSHIRPRTRQQAATRASAHAPGAPQVAEPRRCDRQILPPPFCPNIMYLKKKKNILLESPGSNLEYEILKAADRRDRGGGRP